MYFYFKLPPTVHLPLVVIIVLILYYCMKPVVNRLFFLKYNGTSTGQVALEAMPVIRCGLSMVYIRGIHTAKSAERTVIGGQYYLISSRLAYRHKVSVKGLGGMEVKGKYHITLAINQYLVVLMHPSVHCLF